MELFRCIVVIATLGLAGCQEDPEEAANRLFVESSALLAQYEELPQDNVEERLSLLQQVQENLQRVVSDYPGSSLAVEIVSTGMARNVSIDSINQELEGVSYVFQYNNQCAEDYRICILQEMSDAALSSTYENQALYRAYSGDFDGAISFATTHGIIREELYYIQARLGNIDIALEMLSRNENRMLILVYERQILSIQANSGDIDGALERAGRIEDEQRRNRALEEIYNIQAYSGDFEGAIETARSIDDESYRLRGLQEISEQQASSGDIEGAIETARSIDDEGPRSLALFRISQIQASSGDIEGALETARNIDDEGPRSLALVAAGDIEGALEAARRIENERYREQTLFDIHQIQESSRDIELLLETSTNIEDDDIFIPREIYVIQASSGDIEGALATARSIEDASLRFRALSEIFETLYLQ